MAIIALDPASEISSSGWYYDYTSSLLAGVNDGLRDGSSPQYYEGYIYGYEPDSQITFGLPAGPTVSSVSQVKVWFYGYIENWGSDLQLMADLYIDGVWVGEQAVPSTYESWSSVTFTGTWSSLSDVRIKLRVSDIYGYYYGHSIYAMYAEATYTLGPATGANITGPAGAPVDQAATYTIALNGTNTGTTFTFATDNTGTFSPTSVLLDTSTPSATFTYTPTAIGTHNLSTTNDGGLTNAAKSINVVDIDLPAVSSGTPIYVWDVRSLTGYSANDPVNIVPDLMGSGVDFERAGSNDGPEYQLGVSGGKPGLYFSNDGNDRLFVPPGAISGSAVTVFVVFRGDENTGASDGGAFNVFSTKTNDQWWRYVNNTGYFGVFRNSRVESYPGSGGTVAPLSEESQIVDIVSSGSTYEVTINGVGRGNAGANFHAGTEWVIGGSPSGDAAESEKHFKGWWQFTAIYEGELSSDDRETIYEFLRDTFVLITTPATAITISDGPDKGTVGTPSRDFTVEADGVITGVLTVTPSDGGDGGTFTPASVELGDVPPPTAPTTGLVIHYDAAAITGVSDGDPITEWNASGSVGATMSFSSSFTWVADRDGRPAVKGVGNTIPDRGAISFTPTDFSVAWWCEPISNSNYNNGLGGYDWGGFICHSTTSGSLYLGTDVGNRFHESELPNQYQIGVFNHYCYTFDAATNTGRYYRNGVLLGIKNQADPVEWTMFGVYNSDAYWDDIRVYDRVLSPSEIETVRKSSGRLGVVREATFRYTPASVGTKSITLTNDGSLTNPAAWPFVATPASYRWNFDEITSGKSPESTHGYGAAFEAALTGGPTLVAGQVGQGLDLDGSNDYVTLPTSFASDWEDFSFACWMYYRAQSGNWRRIFDLGNGTTDYIGFWVNGADGTSGFTSRINNDGGTNTVFSNGLLVQDAWVHVAVTKTGGTIKVYLDAVEVSSGSMVFDLKDISTANSWLGISQYGSGDGYLNAILDDVRFENRGWTPTEVSEIFAPSEPATAITLDGPSSGIVGYLSSNFTAQANGSLSGTVVVTPNDGGAGGTFTPTTVSLTDAARTATFKYTAASSGTKTITITNDGGFDPSDPHDYVATISPNSVTYLGTDITTQGTWKGGAYGTDGHMVLHAGEGEIDLPSYASYSRSGATLHTWASPTVAARTLQQPDPSTERLSGCWYSNTEFTVTFTITGSTPKQVAIYCLDHDSLARAFNWQAEDATYNVVGASGTMSDYAQGKWIVLEMLGEVRLRFTRTAGANATISGIMFDPAGSYEPADTYSLSGPSTGLEDVPSNPFTVQLNGPSDGITITPDDNGGGGTFVPTSVTMPFASNVTLIDTFTAADNASAMPSPWSAGSGTWGITNNRAYCSSSIGSNTVWREGNASEVRVSVTLSVAGNGQGVFARGSNNGDDHVLAFVNQPGPGGYVSMWRRVGGSYTQLGSNVSWEVNDGAVLTLECIGDILTMYIDGEFVMARSEAHNLEATEVGLYTYLITYPEFDDLKVEELASTTTASFRYIAPGPGTYTISTSNSDGLFDPDPVEYTVGGEIFTGSTTMPAAINVFQAGSTSLPASINVLQSGSTTMPSTVLVLQTGSTTLPAVVLVRKVGSTNMPAVVTVLQTGSTTMPASISVAASLLWSSINVLQSGSALLRSRILVLPDTPSSVILTADVATGEWTSQSPVTFSWTAATYNTHPILAYHWAIDHSEAASASLEWDSTAGLSVPIPMSLPQYGSGIWYFHVAARNITGFGPVATYQIQWNNTPTVPGTTFMNVNGLDTLFNIPLLASTGSVPRFTWSISSDSDITDTVVYEIQLASRSDFGVRPETGQSSIAKSFTNVATAQLDLSPLLKPGQWFWRIRASDAKQSSTWSPIGSFRFNRPPGAPTSLRVRDV